MKCAIICGNNFRHLWFANLILNHYSDAIVVLEEKPYQDNSINFLERDIFSNCKLNTSVFLTCSSGKVNDDRIVQHLQLQPLDYIFTFGCSLLQSKIYKIPKNGCVNIHTGLVQYYRGVDSSFWAIHDERFDRIGTTLHYIDSSIDGGDIISQKTVDEQELLSCSQLYDVFLKTCFLGYELLENFLVDIHNGSTVSHKNITKGK